MMETQQNGWKVLTPLLLAMVLGVLAGGVGGLAASVYLLPPLVPAEGDLARRFVIETRPASVNPETMSNAVAAATLRLVTTRALEDLGPGAFVPNEAVIGRAVALTSDGWLATSADLSDELQGAEAVAADGSRYAIESVVADPGSGAAFIRVSAVNLSVLPFGEPENVRVGDELLAVAGRGVAASSKVISRGADPRDLSAAVVSSEIFSARFRLSQAFSKTERGSPVIDRNGRMVGLLDGGNASDRAVPVEGIRQVMSGVLREGQVSRPYLGVHAVDFSTLVGLPEGQSASGALLAAAAGKPAVLRNSPASRAGLRAGDIVLAIEGVSISPGQSLSEALRDFDPGDRIELLVLRGEQTFKAVITLGDIAEK